MKIYYKCPYQNFTCPELNQATATLMTDCSQCKYYDNGVRPTGDMPMLEKFINWSKKHKIKLKL